MDSVDDPVNIERYLINFEFTFLLSSLLHYIRLRFKIHINLVSLVESKLSIKKKVCIRPKRSCGVWWSMEFAHTRFQAAV